jgi:acetyl-CoA acetyltransferase
VIVGVGQHTHWDDDDLAGAEPVALIERAARSAGDDSAPDLLRELDVVEIMGVGSWFYDDLPGLVAQRLGADVPAGRRRVLPTGGETPLRALDLAAARIADGDAKVVLLGGAEGTRALTRAKRSGVGVPWTKPTQPRPPWNLGPELEGARALGIERAFDAFPLYEHALRAVEGRTLADAQRESAELWAALSRVAAANPYAWSREEHTADALATVDDDNRMVAYPYTKRLVANPFVNQGAALLLTDTETARAHGIPEDRWVYPWGGAGADEPTDPRARDHYAHNRALEAAVQITQAITRTSLVDYDAIELYSCFPAMPKLTARVLGLTDFSPSFASAHSVPALGPEVSVTGGLSFAGGPGSNYLTHSLAQMVGRLRESGGTGFVHGVGMFNTKHHCLVLSARPSPRGEYPEVPHDPAEPRPPLYDPVPVDEAYAGPLTIETLSVRFGRDGRPERGVVLGRGAEGQRVGARLCDPETMASLTDARDGEPVGRTGTAVAGAPGGPPEFRL